MSKFFYDSNSCQFEDLYEVNCHNRKVDRNKKSYDGNHKRRVDENAEIYKIEAEFALSQRKQPKKAKKGGKK